MKLPHCAGFRKGSDHLESLYAIFSCNFSKRLHTQTRLKVLKTNKPYLQKISFWAHNWSFKTSIYISLSNDSHLNGNSCPTSVAPHRDLQSRGWTRPPPYMRGDRKEHGERLNYLIHHVQTGRNLFISSFIVFKLHLDWIFIHWIL
jgi:hypothetical protein